MDDLSDFLGEVIDERKESINEKFPNILYWASTLPLAYVSLEAGIKLRVLYDYITGLF